jgi:hypothetical protein
MATRSSIGKWVEARVNQGMITSIDAADIPTSALQKVLNARVRYDKTERRSGYVLFRTDLSDDTTEVPKADSTHVLKVATLKDNEGNAYTFRLSPGKVYLLDSGAWVEVTPVTTAVSGGNTDRYKTVVINNQFAFSNNGADYIQLVDPVAKTYDRLGNAPKYKFITGFANRIVGAYRTDGGSHAVDIGWCGNGVITEWDNANDNSAGSTPLAESPSDFADHITGIFGINNALVITRERSIWLASRNPVASNPFNFYNAVPGIGCNAPYSSAPFEGGLCFFDPRTSTVWAYPIGGQPESIGRPIDKELSKNIDDPQNIFGSYNPIENEYIVFIPVVGSDLVKAWTFNFRTKSWSYDEVADICCADDPDVSAGYTAIDDLLGIINNLTGTIDELSPTNKTISSRILGKTDGDILQELTTATDDAGTEFVTELESKLFEAPEDDIVVVEIRAEIYAIKQCELKLYISKNKRDYQLLRTSTINELEKTVLFKYKKQFKARQFSFKITGTGGKFSFMKYEVHAFISGESKR